MLSTRYEYSAVSMLYEDPPTVLNIRESQLCNRNTASQHPSIGGTYTYNVLVLALNFNIFEGSVRCCVVVSCADVRASLTHPINIL